MPAARPITVAAAAGADRAVAVVVAVPFPAAVAADRSSPSIRPIRSQLPRQSAQHDHTRPYDRTRSSQSQAAGPARRPQKVQADLTKAQEDPEIVTIHNRKRSW